jgi:PTH1 family peptidyl-tRNA hydrolase
VGKKPTPEYDLADWVLGKLPKDHSDLIDARLGDIYDASALIVAGKIDDAMQKYSK